MSEHAVVVGGGIAGLATAVALQRRSWQVTVLERKPSISEVGAGITLWPNALRALDALGLGERIRGLGLVQGSGGIRDSRGRWLARTDSDALAARFGDGMVVVERGELLATLRDACRDVRVRTSAEVRGVDADTADPDTAVTLGNGESVRGDVVIGADGVGSAVRGSLWSRARVRSTGMLAARFIGRLADPGDVEGGESWGRGDYAGIAPLPDGRLYVFLVVPVASGVPSGPGEALPWLRHRFASWHDPLPQLLASVEPSQLLVNELADLAPLRTLVHGRAVLVGDAAHAWAPNLGQGACQALEDSVELASALAAGADRDIAQRLRVYDRRRLPRVHRLARRSRSAGRAAGMRGRTTTTVRNALVGAVPDALALRAFDATLDWTPP
ncbi:MULTISPECIES: FAD-dependent oxidoreductase [Prauserella salsuginis group]|uniref:FAD-dependent oxidoreductase n=1 Tax=Prauserella salsuginis TaxID=387889 RepID=A0ABW6FWE3_9PSEU|nr:MULTISPECIES: FAD-dependent oxidoreductase [Prauserella salsuginis group]MCR3720303.1 2-polyprenyl-6-methoxyphenol hydroxylase [Prauserella flava]MCR3733989.1 2-polyprenyl-6-methoxyphenol hydroxylase [Prauserella salsuginis]